MYHRINSLLTVFFSMTVDWSREDAVAHSSEGQYLDTVVGVLKEAGQHYGGGGGLARVHPNVKHYTTVEAIITHIYSYQASQYYRYNIK